VDFIEFVDTTIWIESFEVPDDFLRKWLFVLSTFAR